MVASGEGLVVTSLDNFVYCLSFKNGKRRWKYRLDGRPAAEPLLEGTSVFLLDSSGAQGVVLDLKTGKPVNRLILGPQFEPNGNPVLVKDRLILPTRQWLVAFAPNPAP
jgi:outer membrane protein assembly factor BamB